MLSIPDSRAVKVKSQGAYESAPRLTPGIGRSASLPRSEILLTLHKIHFYDRSDRTATNSVRAIDQRADQSPCGCEKPDFENTMSVRAACRDYATDAPFVISRKDRVLSLEAF